MRLRRPAAERGLSDDGVALPAVPLGALGGFFLRPVFVTWEDFGLSESTSPEFSVNLVG